MLQVFITTASTDVWHASQTSAGATTWTPWSSGFGRQPSGTFKKIAAETNADGRVQVFAMTTPTGVIFTRAQLVTGGWSDWTAMSSSADNVFTAIASARNNDGRLRVYTVDHDWRVFQNTQITAGASTWTGWNVLDSGQTRMTQITAKRKTAGLAAGLIELVGVDSGGRPWRRRQTAANSDTYTTWTELGDFLRADAPIPPPGSTIGNPPR